jgi:hypothetical protein
MNQGSGAHGARLNGGNHYAAAQAMISQPGSGLAHGNDLSVGRGVVLQQITIMAPANDLAIFDY